MTPTNFDRIFELGENGIVDVGELGVFSHALNSFLQHLDRVLQEDEGALKTAWFTLYLCGPPCFGLETKRNDRVASLWCEIVLCVDVCLLSLNRSGGEMDLQPWLPPCGKWFSKMYYTSSRHAQD